MIAHRYRLGNILTLSVILFSGETLVEGLVELWSGYGVTLTRLDSIRPCLVLPFRFGEMERELL